MGTLAHETKVLTTWLRVVPYTSCIGAGIWDPPHTSPQHPRLAPLSRAVKSPVAETRDVFESLCGGVVAHTISAARIEPHWLGTVSRTWRIR